MQKPRSSYGISRIDQPEKKNHGFYVRITHNGKTNQKYFPDKASGNKQKALKLAREYRDSILKKLPKAKQNAAAQKRRRAMKSGVVGVTHVVSKIDGKEAYHYWQAAWNDAGGARRTKKFSIAKHGKKEALELAIQARKGADKPSKTKSASKSASKPARKKAARKKASPRKRS